jgi:hypothetical protein
VSGGATRREALRRGAAAAAVLAAGAPLVAGARAAIAQAETDADIVESLIGLEEAAALAYRTAAASGIAGPRHTRTLWRFARHEQQHAEALLTVLEALGGRAPRPPRTVADVDRILPGLGDARTPEAVLEYALGLESAEVAAYHDAHARLAEPKLLPTTASIMAAQGQHLVVLRAALSQPLVQRAFETGER